MAAMQAAALSGVDVRLMLRTYRQRITHLGSRSYLGSVLRAGAVYFIKAFYTQADGFGRYAFTVGSNVDFRSFEHNFEVNALCMIW